MGWGWAAALNPTVALAGLSTVGNYLGQREANQTNRDIARETTSANMAEASRNREFQREMSNTAFQRQMEDLKRAGLNPLLASGMSGASTPSGSAGNAVGTSVESEFKGLPEGIQAGIAIQNQQLSSAKQGQEIELMRDQQALTKAQAGKAYMETKAISKDLPKADVINSVYDWTKNKFKEMEKSSSEKPVWNQDISNFHKKYENMNKQIDKQNQLKFMMRMK